MKISTQTIKFINNHYGSAGDPAPNGVDDLLQKIGAQLAAVEETEDFGKRFEEVVIVKVVSCEDHPDADRLHVCKVDDGGKVQNVERDDKGLVQIVCGAPNVHVGMLAAWLPPGSTVPSTAKTDPFVLEARDLRGVVSNGMLASPRELSLSDYHEGILDIDEELGSITPGTMFADAFHLRGDVVVDMENKMFTHRPDCFGWLGIARELEGIQHRAYKSPDWYSLKSPVSSLQSPVELKLEVRNELPELVPRFVAIAMSGIKVGPSPVWLQVDLARVGLRSINNIVDYTNYYMLLTGQPLHAYDYDKVKARSDGDIARIIVRSPKSGEKIKLLNGKEVEPRAEAIMIATDKEPIGIGGVMGGGDTEVGEDTTSIILEAANFDMYSIRRTAMAHGLFTDAVTRFNKGQSPLQNLAVMWKIIDQIRGQGAKVASPLVDDNHLPAEVVKRGNIHAPVRVTTQFINERLGWSLSADEMKTLLENVEFTVEVSSLRSPVSSSEDQRPTTNDRQLTVHAPFWRTDIEIPEDVVEEVGRLNGYDKLPLDLPKRDLTPASKNPLLELKNQIRSCLSAAGANEILSYSFVHGNLLSKAGQNLDQAFQLSNALSPDLQYFRLSLTPSLLEKVHPNIKAGSDSFALYEFGKVHNKTETDDEGLPREMNSLALVFAASDRTAGDFPGAPYYIARKYLTALCDQLGLLLRIRFEPLAGVDLGGKAWVEQIVAPFEPSRSAVLLDDQDVVWGVVGEYRASVRRALKLPANTAGFEVGPFMFVRASSKRDYVPLPKFPSIEQDICLKVPADTAYDVVLNFVWQYAEENGIEDTGFTIEPVDIYQREDDTEHKQITLRLSLANLNRTLTDDEVSKLLDRIAAAAKEKLQAERI